LSTWYLLGIAYNQKKAVLPNLGVKQRNE
jgi:hypothetical protein